VRQIWTFVRRFHPERVMLRRRSRVNIWWAPGQDGRSWALVNQGLREVTCAVTSGGESFDWQEEYAYTMASPETVPDSVT
jgi:hypothetical protein